MTDVSTKTGDARRAAHTQPSSRGQSSSRGQAATAVPDAAAETEGGFTPRQVFWLKALVIGLGVAMVACMVVIIARIAYLTATRGGPAETVIAVPTGDAVVGFTLDGDRLGLRLRGGTNSENGAERIEIWSAASGKKLRTIRIERRK
ncbi:MAG: DUF6476 family protein [Pseudomonadota bacterium]